MVIYSVSVRIKKEFENEWLEWMKNTHIPAVLKTGYFNKCEMYRVIIPEVEDNVAIYKMKYECDSFEKYQAYQKNDAQRLQADHKEKYRGKFTASREVMEKL